MKTYFEREQLIWGAALAPTEKLLLLCLNSFVDGKGECFPGKDRLSSMCGIDVRTVTRTVQRLIDAGVISKTARRLGSRQQSNLYRVRFSAIPQDPKPLKIEAESQQDNLSKSVICQQDNLSKSAGQFVQVSRTICPSQQDIVPPDLSIDLSIDLSNEEDPERSFSENASLSESKPAATTPVSQSQSPNDRAAISLTSEKPRDPMGDRLRAGAKPHRYPTLVAAGFGAVWVGPGFRDFDPEAVKAACRHKTKNKLADEYVDGQTYIANAIRDENWAAIEMLVQEVATKQAAQQQAASRHRAAEQQRLERLQTIEPEHSPEELAAIARRQHIARLRIKAALPGERARAIQDALSIGATLADIGLERET